ncbi:uncharacterized protein C16orf46 homolog isoform X2 [Dasypus novemcinctus]
MEPGKLEAEAGALAQAGPEKEQSSLSQPQAPRQGPSAASREVSKICLPCSHGEKKSLQIKEFIWCPVDWAPAEAPKGRDPRSYERPFGGGADRAFSIADPLTSRALFVLPPLKASPPNGSDALGKKSKNFFLQPDEKVLGVEKDECVACTLGWRRVDGKGEKRPAELAKHLKFNEMPPFPSPAARPSLLAPPEQCDLHWSFLPEKNLLCPPNPSNVRYFATLQLLQKQGGQHCQAKFKAKMLRPQKHVLPEAKQENGPQTLETRVFPRSLLPSLTVSRVAIPVSPHRLL